MLVSKVAQAKLRVELFLHCSQKLLHVMRYLLAASKRNKGSFGKEKHNFSAFLKPFFCPPQSIIHRIVASGSFSLCLVIPAAFSIFIIREQTQEGFDCSLTNPELQEKEN